MTNSRRRLRIGGAGALGTLLMLAALVLLNRESAKPAAAPQAAAAAPIAPEQSPPQARARQVQSAQVAKGVRQDYIVQASSSQLARAAVVKAGGLVTGELDIIRAVGAALDERELAALWENPVAGLRVYDDASVSASASVLPETYYPSEVAATPLHKGGLTGRGVTVAVLDSGLWREQGPLQKTAHGSTRVLAQYDTILARTNPSYYASSRYDRDIDDAFGHGTHISSIIANGAVASTGRYQGVAPGVNLVSVKVLDSNGAGRYFDVIRGIQWAVSQRSRYAIRVLNMSLSAPVRSHYWDDPLNQAVMAAWASGIVVVVSAGNEGPAPMSIGVAGQQPVRHHRGRGHGQLPADGAGPVSPRDLLCRRPDLRRLREAGSRGDGRPHPRLRAGHRHARA